MTMTIIRSRLSKSLLVVLIAIWNMACLAQASDPKRTQFIASAQSYINTDEMVEKFVGISSTHPRYQDFRKAFDGMFASDAIVGGMYDAMKENGLLEKGTSQRLANEFSKQWMGSISRKGIPRLETEDQMLLLAARLGFFESIATEQCGKMLKNDTIDSRMFYSWLAGKSETAVRDFMRIVTEATTREIEKRTASESVTEKQVDIAAELVGRNIARSYGQSKAALVINALTDPKLLSDHDYCIAARILWRETLTMKGEARRWLVRGIFM